MKHILYLSALLASQVVFAQPEAGFEGLKPVNGTSLYLKQSGTGEPVLFVHGGPGLSHDYFLPHVSALSEKFSLIFYDQRGCGRSAPDLEKEEVSLDHFVNDMAGILDALSLEKVHVVAHSFGGLLAMKFATVYPGKVKSLILCNSVSASKEFDQLGKQKQQSAITPGDNLARSSIFASADFRDGSPQSYEQLFKISFKRAFYDTLLIDSLHLRLNDNFSKSSRLLFGLGADLVSYDYHSALSGLKAPTLVIHGAADLIPVEVSQKLAGTIPGARLTVMEKSGHFPFIEQNEEFIAVVTSFLSKGAGE